MILQADIVQTNKRRKKVLESLKQEKRKLEDLEKIPNKNKKNIEEYEAQEIKLTEQLETLQVERSKLLISLRAETLTMQEKKEYLQNNLVDLKKIVDETKSAVSIFFKTFQTVYQCCESLFYKFCRKVCLNFHFKILTNYTIIIT